VLTQLSYAIYSIDGMKDLKDIVKNSVSERELLKEIEKCSRRGNCRSCLHYYSCTVVWDSFISMSEKDQDRSLDFALKLLRSFQESN